MFWIQIAKELAEIENLNFTQVRGLTVPISCIMVDED